MNGSDRLDVGDRRHRDGLGANRSRALAAVFVFYAASMLLNGSALYEAASRRPYGPVRQAWVAATRPLAWAARNSRAGRIRAWAERAAPQ